MTKRGPRRVLGQRETVLEAVVASVDWRSVRKPPKLIAKHGVRPTWMFYAAREAQILAGRIALRSAPTAVDVVDVRSVLCGAIPPVANHVERFVLEGLIAVAQKELTKPSLFSFSPDPNTLVGRAACILRDRYAEHWTISLLVHELGTNRFCLTKAFKSAFGVGLHEYLVECRVEAAEDRIQAGEKIETTAYAVGFRSKKTLYAAFRRVRGTSPGTSKRMTVLDG